MNRYEVVMITEDGGEPMYQTVNATSVEMAIFKATRSAIGLIPLYGGVRFVDRVVAISVTDMGIAKKVTA